MVSVGCCYFDRRKAAFLFWDFGYEVMFDADLSWTARPWNCGEVIPRQPSDRVRDEEQRSIVPHQVSCE
jgi:hypothetical protein